MLTQERLKELLHYDPDTGFFTRLVSRGRAKAGDVAGSETDQGYIRIKIDLEDHQSHRLAFLYMTGRFPEHEVDHISGRRSDNRWVNLRTATSLENGRNQKRPITNRSGVLGVHWHRRSGKWSAQIQVNSSGKHLGLFEEFNDAVAARKAAEQQYGFHANHGRSA